MESIAKIRHRYHVKGQKINRIARDLNIVRNTVKKVLHSDDPEKGYSREHSPAPQLGPYLEERKALLEEDEKAPYKEKYTAQRLFETLRERGYQGAYDSIQRFVKSWHEKGGRLQANVYIPLYYAPGEAYQFDWSIESAEIGGAIQTVHLAHVRLCFSRLFSLCAYPGEAQEILFDAHAHAFHFFGGNPIRGIYDNLKTGIDTIFICLHLARTRKHPEQLDHTIWEVFEAQEKEALQPMAACFDGFVEREVAVSSTCLVRCEHNRYSVDCRYARRTVSLRFYADRVVAVADGETIAEHKREFGKNRVVYNPWHYVPLLEREPGALRNGAPFI